jgi:hypothetical protein
MVFLHDIFLLKAVAGTGVGVLLNFSGLDPNRGGLLMMFPSPGRALAFNEQRRPTVRIGAHQSQSLTSS